MITVNLNNGKQVKIPEGDILKIKKGLNCSAKEAIRIWLNDENLIPNEEQNILDKKAKESGISRTIHGAGDGIRKTQSERVKKENPTKEKIISAIAEILPTVGAENISVVNTGKLIEFSIGGNSFKLDLVQKRKAK